MSVVKTRIVRNMANVLTKKRDQRIQATVFVGIFAVIGVLLLVIVNAAPARDVFQRPYSANSIWNTPIGSNARYVDAGFPYTNANALDPAYFLELKSSDPLRDYVLTGGWRERCSGTKKTGVQLNLPNGYLIPDAEQKPNGSWSTPNNGWEFLLPDGETMFYSGGGARCSGTGPIYGHGGTTTGSVYGDGIRGGHGASRMPRLGGAIRPGELSNDEPIQHVLDLVLYTKHMYSDNKQTRESTYRWPATGSDAYALDRNKTDRYVGSNPEVRMGSLLALPPNLKPEDLNINTKEGRKLFAALRDWGGYITDDSAWNANYLTVDSAANDFQWGTAQRQEFGRMVDALHVVTNNGPNSIGGGGEPRVPKHPAFRNGGGDQPPAPDPEPPVDDETDPTQGAYILPADNLVVPSSVVASSQVSDTFTPDKAIDGDEQTNESRWTSAREDNQWIQFDLEQSYEIEKLSILWAGNTTNAFEVQLSNDGENFNTVDSGSTDNQMFTLTEHDLNNSTARYVRVVGLTRWNNNFGHSVREVGIYVGDESDAPDEPTDDEGVTLPYRVNSGGGSFIDNDGNEWRADENFLDGGGTYATSDAIAGTEIDELYQSERWCSAGYEVPIANGQYTVVFHGAEINPRSEGRVFSVESEGVTIAQSLNLSQEVGNFSAYSQTQDVSVNDGSLSIRLEQNVSCPKISGFEILNTDSKDTQSPEVSILNIAHNDELSGEVQVNVEAQDNRQVAAVALYIDGTLVAQRFGATAVFTLDTTQYANGDYVLQAVAVDTSGNESVDEVAMQLTNEITDTTPPTVPNGFATSEVTSENVRLIWQTSTDVSGVDVYEVLRNGQVYARTADTSYNDLNVEDQTSYTYAVRAVDTFGNVSDTSSPITVETPAAVDTEAPTTPGTLTATAFNDGPVRLEWGASTDNRQLEGYFVYRSGRIIASLEETDFIDRTAVSGQTYEYWIRAYDTARNLSSPTNTQTVTISPPADTQSPSKPTNLQHVRYLPWRRQHDIRWNASTDNSGAVQYNIIRNNRVIATTSATSFSDATIKPRTAYRYFVSAFDEAGNTSARSNKLFFKANR